MSETAHPLHSPTTGHAPTARVPSDSTPPVIVDTFAEAFPMTGLRLIITADSQEWATTAGQVITGYATSVINCDAEAGIERVIPQAETPDGRPGLSVLMFGFSRDALQKAATNRVGQCILTCPTTACYNGIDHIAVDRQISIGGQLRFFGDGWQSSKVLAGGRYWRIPVMDGEFLCEDRFGTVKGVGGGNLLIGGVDGSTALRAAEVAATAARTIEGVILPFPGGVVRSGSKVGSRYKTLRASTNERYCPTLRGVCDSALNQRTQAMYEIVIDGLSLAAVEQAMKAALLAALEQPGVTEISAGNYGGKLGPHHISLHTLLQSGKAT